MLIGLHPRLRQAGLTASQRAAVQARIGRPLCASLTSAATPPPTPLMHDICAALLRSSSTAN